MSKAELTKFYKGRAGRPERFTYNEEGDLVIYKKKGGEIDQVITLPTYREPTEAEIEAQEAERREAIAAAEVEFETALRELRSLIEAGAEPSELLAANKRVAAKDTLLQQARFPVMTVSKGMSFPVRDILFEERRQDYMIQGVQLTNTRPFTLKDMYVREGEALGSEAAIAAEEAIAAAEEEVLPPVPTIVFDGTDDVNGFMAWDYRSNITVDGVVYRTAYHAIMAGMAKYYGNSDRVEEIMSTKRARKIKFDYENVGTSEEDWNGNFEEIVEKVMRLKFAPGTELAERLLATGETVLGAIIPGDTVYGIGIDATDEGVGVSGNWTGQNKLGQLLERIRAELRESAAAAASKKKKKPTFVVEEEEEAAPMAAQVPSAAMAAELSSAPAAAAAAAELSSASKKKKKPVLVAEEGAAAEQPSAAAADAIVESTVAASIAADSQAPAAAAEQPSATAAKTKKSRKLRFVVEEN